MGRFVNPDNSAFQVALNSEIYVDKTGLIEYTNRVMNTNQAMICNSRPRRFGKSITANMLTAYIKLATYASRCIENEILMYLRKNANRKGEVSFD
ncbi:MAG: AAA family ATPase, partial [Lachnospiraceae bacterium]|nr:AAA family ATPase [Lachnospiraceae bacterium]